MKAYPKPEKEVICFECEEPVLLRNDLFLITDTSSKNKYQVVPIHVDCYGRYLKKKPYTRFFNQIKMQVNALVIVFAFFVLFFGIYFLFLVLTVEFIFSAMMLIMAFGFAFLTFRANRRSKKMISFEWGSFEKYLPAACEQCTETIPPGEQVCGACGWKYGQSASKSKQKLKH